MCYLRVVRPRPRRSPDRRFIPWSGSQDAIDDRNDSRRGDLNRPLAIRARHPFLWKEPSVHVAAAVRTGPNEMLLTVDSLLDTEFVRRTIDHAFHESVIESLSEELLRLEPRLSDPLGHHVHLDPPLGLRPVRELDDHLFAAPLHHAEYDRDRPRDDCDRPAQVEQFRDVPEEGDEEQAEAHREAADGEIR